MGLAVRVEPSMVAAHARCLTLLLALASTHVTVGAHVDFDYRYSRHQRPLERSTATLRLYRQFQAGEERFGQALDQFAGLRDELAKIPLRPSVPDAGEPHWENEYLPALDAIALYGFLARNNPRTYLEIGSGNSTRFAARAIADHGLRTRIVSIDPEPRSEIDRLCHEVVRKPFETIDPAEFDGLTADDVVFLDGSHRSFQSSDVTVFFMELLPVLPKGVLYGIHDIFLPFDYPPHWVDRYYNEQYLLGTYLFGGADGDEVLLPCHYVSGNAPLAARLDGLWSLPALRDVKRYGCAFWARRGGLRNA